MRTISRWSTKTKATIASTMGTALGTTHGSCRPLARSDTSWGQKIGECEQKQFEHFAAWHWTPLGITAVTSPGARLSVTEPLNPDRICLGCSTLQTLETRNRTSPARLTVFCSRLMVLVGLKAIRMTMCSPLEMPPVLDIDKL